MWQSDSFNLGDKVRGREGTGNDQRKINNVTIIKIYLTKKRKRKDTKRDKVKA